ncbi:TPM domain-containing protein [Symmachiella dynata]|uniref:TPM domain-containing protein n=1 Tax=Symmachiella dynata TaxID=2527995 RepID=UPI0030EBB313
MVARSTCLLLCVLLGFAPSLYGQVPQRNAERITVPLPERGHYVIDSANLLDEAAEQSLQQIAEDLQAETASPLYVVTIDSLAAHGGGGLQIEAFSKTLLEQWQFESPRAANWPNSILLLVAKEDRKARIQFFRPRGRKDDRLAQEIMDVHIVRQFKRGQFGEGIVAGATGLDSLVRNKTLPSAPWPMWVIVVLGGAGGLFLLFSISLYRSGLDSWAWRSMKAVIDGFSEGLSWDYGGHHGSYSGGGEYSGGGFSSNGGCSDSGGATGSW